MSKARMEKGAKSPRKKRAVQSDPDKELERRVRDRTARLSDALGRLQEEIVEKEKAAQVLRASEERFSLALQGAGEGLWDWDLTTDEVYYCPQWMAMLGFEAAAMRGTPDLWLDRVHPADQPQVRKTIRFYLDGMFPRFESEHRLLHQDGSYHWMLARGLAVRDTEGKALRMAGSQTDITDRKQHEDQLLHDAFHDALTGLPNRALFLDRLSHAAERKKRHPQHAFAVLFADLDLFKNVNDSLGHVIGDILLMEVAQRLQKCLRSGDTVARFGGDEFSVLLDELEAPDQARTVAERMREVVEAPFSLDGHEIYMTASVGIACSREDYIRPEDILRDADTAMYRAKALGRACTVMFDPGMHETAVRRLQLETELRKALEKGEFSLHYQPIVSLGDGSLAGFEALIRWNRPDGTLVLPGEFIPLAEETGMILSLGRWVLVEACRQMRAWHRQYPGRPHFHLSVNLSPRQFSKPNLAHQIDLLLRESHLLPQHLWLEVTEGTILENEQWARAIFRQFRDLDIHILLDDFGTGYSSMSFLHKYRIHALKIDKSFISGGEAAGTAADVVPGLVRLAKELGIQVVAEGIETRGQLDRVRDLKCDYGQGFFFSKAVDSAAAGCMIAEWGRKDRLAEPTQP